MQSFNVCAAKLSKFNLMFIEIPAFTAAGMPVHKEIELIYIEPNEQPCCQRRLFQLADTKMPILGQRTIFGFTDDSHIDLRSLRRS
jgi:hypothetical protein